MQSILNICDELIKAGEGEGSKGGNVIGHTQSGKPIYASAGSANHKEFTAKDHHEAAMVHGNLRERKAMDRHRLGNSDGTISKKQMKQKEKLQKEIDKHSDYQSAHRAKAYKLENKADPSGPSQKDFDRADRKGDKDRRSRGWGRSMDIGQICDDLIKSGEGSRGGKIIGHTRRGKPIYETTNKTGMELGYTRSGKEIFEGGNEHSNFSKEDHQDASALHHEASRIFKNNSKQYKQHKEHAASHEEKLSASERPGEGSARAHIAEHGLSRKPTNKSISSICDDLIKGVDHAG